MNPDPHGEGLKLNISETDNAQDIELALSVASVFRVKEKRAQQIVSEVTGAVNQWRSIATSHGLPPSAQDRMRRAFGWLIRGLTADGTASAAAASGHAGSVLGRALRVVGRQVVIACVNTAPLSTWRGLARISSSAQGLRYHWGVTSRRRRTGRG